MGKKTGHNGGGKLRPFTSENSEDMGRRGGIATGEARRRRRSMSELASVMMGQKLQGRDAEKVGALFPDLGGEVTQAAAVVAGQVAAARKGSTQVELYSDGDS